MSTDATAVPARACAVAALAAGEEPAGWAIAGRRFLLIEVPLPWPSEIERAATLPPGLREVLDSRADSNDPYLEAIAPDPEHSVPDHTRVVFFDRLGAAAPRFTRSEHLVVTADVADMVRSWLEGGPSAVSRSTAQDQRLRDIIVCTHGSHDSCCGRLGAHVYRELRDRYASSAVRVWRGSHTGGHRFAPTLLDLPTGRSWARLESKHLAALIGHDGHPEALRGRYRGWAMLPTFYERLVETELLFTRGWSWLDLAITGTVVRGQSFLFPEDEGELDDQAVVRLTASPPQGGSVETWEALVERGTDTLTRGECGAEPWQAPRYHVTDLRLLVPESGLDA